MNVSPSSCLSRRGLLRQACQCGLGLAVAGSPLPLLAAGGDTKRTNLTPDQVLDLLKKGNEGYRTEGPLTRAGINRDRRLEIARGQTPIAVLVSCSDSRVPPELLFGRGLGELFIVRNAGNTVDTVAIGSIEYGVQVLGVPLVVVLGHERCGAVDAAVSVVEKNATFPGSIGSMIEPIVPAVLRAKAGGAKGDDLLDASVRENVRRVVARLRTNEPQLSDPIKSGKLKVVGARYDLDDGDVDFFDA